MLLEMLGIPISPRMSYLLLFFWTFNHDNGDVESILEIRQQVETDVRLTERERADILEMADSFERAARTFIFSRLSN
jgi:hypothetical protein